MFNRIQSFFHLFMKFYDTQNLEGNGAFRFPWRRA